MDECPICINPLTEKNICKTKCEHSYCLSCLLEHLTYNKACPLCRSVIFDFIKKVEDTESEEEDDETPVIVYYKMSYYNWLQVAIIQIITTHIVLAFSPFIKIIRPKL
jgi:hypothetical protein